MKKSFLTILVCVFILGFIACKDGGPVGPQLPDNVFKVTDIQNIGGPWFGNYSAIASYSNYDDSEASVSGKIYFGDGASESLAGPNIQKGSGTWQSWNVAHVYEARGTYKVKVELTAYFKRGSISSTFEKDFTIN